MGKYDVTLGQYVQFLNAVAATDTYGCYNDWMQGQYYTTFPFGIAQTGSPGSYTYSVTGSNPQAPNMPVFDETWGDAARFCNWLQNGQPTGAEGNGTTETGAYTLSGATSNAALAAVAAPAHSGAGAARYFIPTENEWYKAAYYVGGGTNAGYWTYPTQSNALPDNSLYLAKTEPNDANYYLNSLTDSINYLTPVGTFTASPGPYGTFDMGGDLDQWNETNINNGYRGLRGGPFETLTHVLESYDRYYDGPAAQSETYGFRVASSIAVPEPCTLALLGVAGFALLFGRRQR
jgi:formylglycine-generating enzyme required for sulfatase activity